jgi:TRAP-type mannitol/chloroaromatic compound transport system permease large subunit
MAKLIGMIVAILVIVLLVLGYLQLGKRTAQEGKAVVETTQGALRKARESAEEINQRIKETNKEAEKIMRGEKE